MPTNTLFKIQDVYGRVYATTTTPAILFDSDSNTLLQMGDIAKIRDSHSTMTLAYKQENQHEMADYLAVIYLPLDQEIIDKTFQDPGYIATLRKNNPVYAVTSH